MKKEVLSSGVRVCLKFECTFILGVDKLDGMVDDASMTEPYICCFNKGRIEGTIMLQKLMFVHVLFYGCVGIGFVDLT